MRFFHISDLHLGIRLFEFSLLDDQRDILIKIISHAVDQKPDAVIIAGDVYDKNIPTVEAIQLMDWFLVELNKQGIAVYMIAGNHDSAERVSFAASLLGKSDVHISETYKGKILPIRTQDEYGEVNIWLMPYLKPSIVRAHFRDREIASYSEAVQAAFSNLDAGTSGRNILVAHQFVTGALRCESDEVFVGGSENVDAALFDAFDYVALGHLHRPQNIYRETLRYCGTPLKYSLSEADHVKSITSVDIERKGNVTIREIPLTPLRDLRVIRGTYKELTAAKNYSETNNNDYVYVVLTDEDEEPEAIQKMRNIYPNITRLRYDNARTQTSLPDVIVSDHDNKEPVELFAELYEMMNGQPMSDMQREYSLNLLEKIREENA